MIPQGHERRARSHLLDLSLMEMRRLHRWITEEPDFRKFTLEATSAIVQTFRSGGKILTAGNGGSAADAQHFAAEFVGRFSMDRPALPVIAINSDSCVLTALSNDYGFSSAISRQLRALGDSKDVFVAFSTSGSSPNILEAARVASTMGLTVISFTGANGSALKSLSRLSLIVPSTSTARVQEVHEAAYHLIAEMVESRLFESLIGEENSENADEMQHHSGADLS